MQFAPFFRESNILQCSIKMALKRKRSSPTFSSPYSDSTTVSDFSSPNSLPFFYAQTKPTEPLYHKPTWSFPTYESDDGHDRHVSSPHLNSRTRKRHRDGRPDEKAIYGAFQSSCVAWIGAAHMAAFADFCRCAASTMSRLYEAQRNLPKAERVLSQPTNSVKLEEPVQRSTLHSFWKIGGAAPANTVPMSIDSAPSSSEEVRIRCEDCDGPLQQDDSMDLDDDITVRENACSSCQRCVCDKCAVLGDARICLACASWSGR